MVIAHDSVERILPSSSVGATLDSRVVTPVHEEYDGTESVLGFWQLWIVDTRLCLYIDLDFCLGSLCSFKTLF